MKPFILLIDLTVLLLLFGFFVFFIHQTFNIIFRGYAPFITTKKRIIKSILDNLELADDCVIYELGCGRAGFLRAARKKFPKAKLTGFENSAVLYWQAKIQSWLTGTKIDIIKRNLFMVDLSSADVVYCYLNHMMMAKLLPKFRKELADTATIVSFQFKIPELEPIKILQGDKASEKIYFYKI